MTRLPKAPIGRHPFVDWCKKVLAAIEERTVLEGPGIRAAREKNGTRLWADLSGVRTSQIQVRRLVVIVVNDDTLDCGEVGSSTVTVEVAKPRKLQRTPWDGKTFSINVGLPKLITYTYQSATTRQASSNEGLTENQIIVPAYIEENDIIYAMRVNDTGVDGVNWQDMNNDGRAWARLRDNP